MVDYKDYRLEMVYSCSRCTHFERMTARMEKHLKDVHGIINPKLYLEEEEDE